MRTVISDVPGANVSRAFDTRQRRADPHSAASRAPESLWARPRPGTPALLLFWILRHRLLAVGIALALLLSTAAILPAAGIGQAWSIDPASGLARSAFPRIGAGTSPGTIAAVQLPGPSGPSTMDESRGASSSTMPAFLPASSSSTARSMLVGMDFPAGIAASLPGQEGQHSLRSLLLAFALAVFLVYLVTASQLESLLNPLSILFTVPMGLIGAAWGLYATGATLNAVALIGTILLAGILVNNAIVLIDAIRNARARGKRVRDAMIQASRTRVRPIMITSVGTVLGLLPMAIGVGEGTGIRRPMTITVIAGLGVATFLVAVAIPVLYALLNPRVNKTI